MNGTAGRARSLLHVFPTFAIGGAQVRFASIAAHLGTACRHAIVAIDGDTACRARLRPDLLVDYLNVPAHKGDLLGNVLRYRGVLRDLNPSMLVTYNWGAIEWAIANRLVGLPHVHIEDGFGPEERERQLPRRVWARRLVLRHATVVLPSRTLERIALDVWRLPERNVRYVPNGVDLTRFTPADIGDAGHAPVIGTVAALRPEKQLSRLLRAFAIARQAHPARLAIVGNGPDLAALQAQAHSLGLSACVDFLGYLATPQDAYRRFAIFAMSSDTEQMPLSLLEAMASGLPVAATAVGDIADMLSEPNRRFAVPCDDLALADALRTLLADRALRHRLCLANRTRAEAEYDQRRMFATYAGIFMSPNPGGPPS